MRVRCDRVVDALGQPQETSQWLTPGREYMVLEITASPGGRVLLRIVGDDGNVPGLDDAALFTSVSSAIPDTWTAAVDEAGAVTIGPDRWKRSGFWEDFFDYKPEAVALFEEEYRAMLRSQESG